MQFKLFLATWWSLIEKSGQFGNFGPFQNQIPQVKNSLNLTSKQITAWLALTKNKYKDCKERRKEIIGERITRQAKCKQVLELNKD
jgi:hypothetical protein